MVILSLYKQLLAYSDKQVTLTANVSLSSPDAPLDKLSETFTITVPGDSSAIADAQ